jgi:hypothetical protein
MFAKGSSRKSLLFYWSRHVRKKRLKSHLKKSQFRLRLHQPRPHLLKPHQPRLPQLSKAQSLRRDHSPPK